MIENFIKNIFDIDNKIDFNYPFIIFDIGSRDCIQSIEFYKLFPMLKYMLLNVILILLIYVNKI